MRGLLVVAPCAVVGSGRVLGVVGKGGADLLSAIVLLLWASILRRAQTFLASRVAWFVWEVGRSLPSRSLWEGRDQVASEMALRGGLTAVNGGIKLSVWT